MICQLVCGPKEPTKSFLNNKFKSESSSWLKNINSSIIFGETEYHDILLKPTLLCLYSKFCFEAFYCLMGFRLYSEFYLDNSLPVINWSVLINEKAEMKNSYLWLTNLS